MREAGVQRGHRGLQAHSSGLSCFCRDTNVRFSAELRRLQSLPKCERLPLPSFLLLPFQRITRLRMLLQVPWGWGGGAFPAPPTPGSACPAITICHPAMNTGLP